MEEKESELTAVSLEREELKSKLTRLQTLVTTYMKRGAWTDAESAHKATDAVQGTFSFSLSLSLSLSASSLYPFLAFACGFLTMRRDFGRSNALRKLFQTSPVTKRRERSFVT